MEPEVTITCCSPKTLGHFGARTAHFTAQRWVCITGASCLLAMKLFIYCLTVPIAASRDGAVLLLDKTSGKDPRV